MAMREIIEINEELCNGCGDCAIGCSEGALQIINGKAKLVKDDFCDGFGACVGTCPTGALKITKRDANEFDLKETKEHVTKLRGKEAGEEMEKHFKEHMAKANSQHGHSHGGGCPGSRMMNLKNDAPKQAATPVTGASPQVIKPELEQWPVMLHLVSPNAPYLNNRELVLLSTCSPVASPDVNWRYVRGRSVVVACPKLDNSEGYIEKLATLMSNATIPKFIIVRMEVPCCGGLTHFAKEAYKIAGRADLILEEHIISLQGEVKGINRLA